MVDDEMRRAAGDVPEGNNYLLAGSKGSSEFFPWHPQFFSNIKVVEKQNSLVPLEPVSTYFVIPLNLKNIVKKTAKKVFAWHQLAKQICLFCKSKVEVVVSVGSYWVLFASRELVSFVHPRELLRFGPWHMTRSPPMEKCIWVWRINLCHSITSICKTPGKTFRWLLTPSMSD